MMRLFRSRWVTSFIGAALLCGLAWFMGPLLEPLEAWEPRLGVILLVLTLWAGINLLLELRADARERALEAGVGAGGDAAGEMAAIEQKITTALALLKSSGGRGYLYEQPWYAIIGPPGAGKTTALLNAGLKFPLADKMGRGAVAGVGGTRLCEWWFTEQAVLIDTAGRYTTQDSDASVDRAGWQKFLDLLKRTRPKQPLNGVIVAIALSDIALATDAERDGHARAIRARIAELEQSFGIRLPVYALFTKADLLVGFSEFFDDLDRDGRAQVWGTTFPLTGVADVVAAFTAAFRPMVESLGNRMFSRLQTERSPERRALIAGFPTQVASLEAPLTGFMTAAFAGTGAPMLRGVYLNSATQEGTPIDRLTGAIGRAFGLSPQQAERLRPQEGRTYFLTRLLRDVVFNEAMLAGGGHRRKKRSRAVGLVALAVSVVVVLGAAGALWLQYSAGQAAIAAAAERFASYEQTANGLKLDPVSDADLASLAPLLDQAGAARADTPTATPGWWEVLSQEGKLATARSAVYRHALERALFPRLIWRLEAQLRGNLSNPEFLYEATRVYLMLCGAGPLDRDLLREWMTLDWQAGYPGAANAPLRQSLERHLMALLAEPLPEITADGELVARARETFGKVTIAQRIYLRIRPSAAAQALAPWRPSDALGAAGSTVFVRASGRSMDDGIPGFLTVEGFHRVMLPSLPKAAQEVASEAWVFGEKLSIDPESPQARALSRDVLALYEADYARAWDEMLADLNLAPLRSLTRAAQDLYIVSSEHSPMRALLVAVARQLTLSEPPGGASVRAAPATTGGNETGARLQNLLRVATPGAGAAADAKPGAAIDARYKALRDLVGTGNAAPIDLQLKTLGELQQQLAKLAAAGAKAGSASGGDDPALALKAAAQSAPQPVARWLSTAAASGVALRTGDAKQQVVAAWNAPDGPAAMCAAAVNGRYPFTPAATTEIPMEQFARLFGPGGVIDGFFNTLLRPYVDVSSRPWKPQSLDGVAAPAAAGEVAMFQRAAQIRELFFPDGRATPSFRLDITPDSLDAKARGVLLDLDGTLIIHTPGPSRATEVTWPGTGGTPLARLLFDPPATGVPNGWLDRGDWARIRLFGRGKLVPSANGEKSALSFQMAERQAAFTLHTGPRNPMTPGVLQGFRCPVVQ